MNCDLGILGIKNLIPIAAFHGIFEYSSNNIQAKIFKFSYLVHLMITNIFVFVFGPEWDPKYIRIRICVKKNIPNIFVFVFGPQKIRSALGMFPLCKKKAPLKRKSKRIHCKQRNRPLSIDLTYPFILEKFMDSDIFQDITIECLQ